MESKPRNLTELLVNAAVDSSENGLCFYPVGSHGGADDHVSVRLTYPQLLQTAQVQSQALGLRLAGSPKETVVVLVFDNQYENVIWFWSVVLAGFVPCVSQPLNNDLRQRKIYFQHLNTLFSKPLFLTSSTHTPEFLGLDKELWIQQIENLSIGPEESARDELPGLRKSGGDMAAIMLTSGSSGNSKGVIHLHQQMLDSIRGKAEYHEVTKKDTFLNWIGLDHDANLAETHLQAMWLISEQIHVHKDDVISALREGPLLFLKLLSKHKVSHTFAPHGFLDSVRLFLAGRPADAPPLDIDLSPLRNWISGGERNVVASVNALTDMLQRYGAPKNLIRPGFGMTETCAGSIYNRRCPEADLAANKEHAMLGLCIPGIEMRVVDNNDESVGYNVSGDLQVKGPIVTTGYFNNKEATDESFTDDGWFKTGDIAEINSDGYLVITGRAKDDIIINGVHHYPNDMEMSLNEAGIPGLTPTYNVVFAHRPAGAATEVICMVYLPTYEPSDTKARVETLDAIGKIILTQTGSLPYRVIPLPAERLQKTSLGKLSSKKISAAFEAGEYDQYFDDEAVREYRNLSYAPPTNETERKILDVFKRYEGPGDNFGIDSNISQIGMDSIRLLHFIASVQETLALPHSLHLADFFDNTTPRQLASRVSVKPDVTYNPQVTLQPQGSKTPLWLIHPGMGEVLVFMPLARYFNDRPVYALRPKGLDGDEHFKDIPEAAQLYYKAVIKAQPTGPYALLGYSFGGSMAFEVGKLLEASGRETRFLGAIDQPPQLRGNSQRADWYSCLAALSAFLELLKDADRPAILARLREEKPSREDAVKMIVEQTTTEQMSKLEMTNKKLQNWASVAFRLKEIGRDYDPEGQVKNMDVFYVKFRPYRAKDDDDWLKVHLGEWQQYVKNEVQFHFCEGTHYDMITTHRETFQRRLKRLLAERGL